jgi:2-haloacid dehalogenase
MTQSNALSTVRALAFDVFGTVVDWRAGIAREAAALATEGGRDGDWEAFADAWRAGYGPAMDRVRRGELPWMNIDALHRLILDSIVADFGLGDLDEAARTQLNRAWHRLAPWPDSVEGLARLKRRFTITTLSNGNFSLLVNMARHAGLPWDCVISAELFGHYKPDPETYLGTARLLDVAPSELMLVAAHPGDLRAARAQGCRTAYVIRPLEFGAGHPLPDYAADEFDIVADDFLDLARRLGA